MNKKNPYIRKHRTHRSLFEEYSSDGAHLNAEGNRRIASAVHTEFVE